MQHFLSTLLVGINTQYQEHDLKASHSMCSHVGQRAYTVKRASHSMCSHVGQRAYTVKSASQNSAVRWQLKRTWQPYISQCFHRAAINLYGQNADTINSLYLSGHF